MPRPFPLSYIHYRTQDLAIAETNVGYQESGVNAQLRLVHADYEGTSYDESLGFSQALSDIRGTRRKDGPRPQPAHPVRCRHRRSPY